MKREFLRGLGLEDDIVQKIIDEHHDTLRKKENEIESLNDQLKAANDEIANRDQQITELQSKVGDNDELKSELEQYKVKNNEYESKLKETQLNSAIKLAVAKDANDASDILAFINKDELTLKDDGNVKGLDKAIGALKESKPYLFSSSKATGSSPQQGDSLTGKPTKEDFSKMSYTEQVELLNNDPDLYRELSN